MPLAASGRVTVDYAEEGLGEPVVLIHSSVSGNRQWRALSEALADRYRALAINLFGYGETTPWPDNTSQSVRAQASLVLALPAVQEGPVQLVVHSFGASVALKAALLLGSRVKSLVLIEPNPFNLLKQQGRTEEAITELERQVEQEQEQAP
jgi:pimeloyl-ACP methyl ester carboxylesterase